MKPGKPAAKGFGRFRYLAACLVCLWLPGKEAFCSETYFIDDNPVVFYKVINWWHDCLPQASTRLCGRRIRYENRGNAVVTYAEAKRVLTIRIRGGVADLLSIFQPCQSCRDPDLLRCQWLDRRFFGDGQGENVENLGIRDDAIIFTNVDRRHAKIMGSIEKGVYFILEGRIGGLLGDKIALHRSGPFLKECPGENRDLHANSPVVLKIMDPGSNAAIGQYAIVRGTGR